MVLGGAEAPGAAIFQGPRRAVEPHDLQPPHPRSHRSRSSAVVRSGDRARAAAYRDPHRTIAAEPHREQARATAHRHALRAARRRQRDLGPRGPGAEVDVPAASAGQVDGLADRASGKPDIPEHVVAQHDRDDRRPGESGSPQPRNNRRTVDIDRGSDLRILGRRHPEKVAAQILDADPYHIGGVHQLERRHTANPVRRPSNGMRGRSGGRFRGPHITRPVRRIPIAPVIAAPGTPTDEGQGRDQRTDPDNHGR